MWILILSALTLLQTLLSLIHRFHSNTLTQMEFQHSCTYKNELSLVEPLLKEENKADDEGKDDEKAPTDQSSEKKKRATARVMPQNCEDYLDLWMMWTKKFA